MHHDQGPPVRNATEAAEREYLEEIKEKLLLAIRRVDDAVKQFSTELQQKKRYIHEHQSDMDEADLVAARTLVVLISSRKGKKVYRCTSASIPSWTSGSART
jgi:hypothetical protein